MKRGESIIYTAVESTQHHDNFLNYHHRGIYTQSYNEDNGYSYKSEKTSFYRAASNQRSDQKCYGDKQPLYKVVVKVGKREFSGEGISAQEARHDAASKALQVLLSLPVNESCLAKNSTCDGSNSGGSGTTNFDYSTNLKSPVSLVHEIALKRNLHVQFEIISEEGPSHMKTFVTQCQVGDKFHTIGEGSSKKESKKRAAEKMLELLRTLPSIYPVDSLPKEKRKTKKKSKKLIKDIQIRTDKQDQKFEANTQEDVNPISRLVQIQQAKKEKEPVFTLKDERGTPGRQEFIMEVKVGEHSFISSGPSKKIAKRNAAEGLLQQLGYASSTVTSSGHSLPQQHTPKHVKLGGEKPSTPSTSSKFGGVSGRQIVPGLHLMNDNKATNNQHTPHKGINLKTSATIAKEYLSNGNSHTADALAEHKKAKLSPVVRPTEKLMNLAQVLSFQVQFSDFPKGNHSEYLSLVSLAIDPAQVCLGVGITTELSHDQAALNALKSLSEIGWDSITPVSTKKEDQIGNFPPPSIIQNDEIYLNLPDEGTNYLNEK